MRLASKGGSRGRPPRACLPGWLTFPQPRGNSGQRARGRGQGRGRPRGLIRPDPARAPGAVAAAWKALVFRARRSPPSGAFWRPVPALLPGRCACLRALLLIWRTTTHLTPNRAHHPRRAPRSAPRNIPRSPSSYDAGLPGPLLLPTSTSATAASRKSSKGRAMAEILSLPPFRNALLALALTGAAFPLLGVAILSLDLVGARFAVMHAALLGAALGLLAGFPALPAGLLGALVAGLALARLSERERSSASGSLGLVWPFSPAGLHRLPQGGRNSSSLRLFWGSVLASDGGRPSRLRRLCHPHPGPGRAFIRPLGRPLRFASSRGAWPPRPRRAPGTPGRPLPAHRGANRVTAGPMTDAVTVFPPAARSLGRSARTSSAPPHRPDRQFLGLLPSPCPGPPRKPAISVCARHRPAGAGSRPRASRRLKAACRKRPRRGRAMKTREGEAGVAERSTRRDAADAPPLSRVP
jgi:hypothetical protein